ncbi:peptide-methionine (S)-S-oxide reductase [Colwellia hornerae]|uniref:peptide-methionine (S)-S-oxide reductase n=1 Tax=Colwellia hornerae TaxID=89402 RepID=A0A5C6Q8S7_9GAMM|nr:peptide-methionine (S)-S-oxide reductase [Colwellia hornerae]TWX53047.1 peptide methionine sulfoxide reductase [Colwellia hornerae]TWX59310.1 peptide methionine sulfoxide reductase [Colwellia hornerae]TWX65435.1 peptide methionine sulfoxide reductase [Colwellia hornerae]
MHNENFSKVGLGGGCHWCTEGVFESLIGIKTVKQGWISSIGIDNEFSEAIEVYFDQALISLQTLIEIHLHTHASTSNHSMRQKYRSAIYTYNDDQNQEASNILDSLQSNFDKPIITKVLPFESFKENKGEFLNYLYNSPNKPFCKTYIHPKLSLLLTRFKPFVNSEKLASSGVILKN